MPKNKQKGVTAATETNSSKNSSIGALRIHVQTPPGTITNRNISLKRTNSKMDDSQQASGDDYESETEQEENELQKKHKDFMVKNKNKETCSDPLVHGRTITSTTRNSNRTTKNKYVIKTKMKENEETEKKIQACQMLREMID